MYAFKLSGENAAAAPLTNNVVTVREPLPQLVQMKSCFGESAVSDTMTEARSGEIASSFPGTLVAALTELPPKIIRPC